MSESEATGCAKPYDLPCLCARCRKAVSRERRLKSQPDDALRRLALLVAWSMALENRGLRTLGEVTKKFLERYGVSRTTLFRMRANFNRRGLAGLADGRADNGGRRGKYLQAGKRAGRE